MKTRPLQREDYALILPWFNDEETQAWLAGIYPVSEQLKLQEISPDKHFWLAMQADVPVGLIELEVEGDLAYPLILVAPAFRGRGFGHEIVVQLILLAKQLNVKEIEAGVSVNNTASGKCFERAGFSIREEVDNFNYYTFQLPTAASDQQME